MHIFKMFCSELYLSDTLFYQWDSTTCVFKPVVFLEGFKINGYMIVSVEGKPSSMNKSVSVTLVPALHQLGNVLLLGSLEIPD